MSFKEHLRSALSMYFVIAALINGAMFVLGKIFRPDEKFGYSAFIFPLLYAAFAIIPMLLMYSKKELTVKQHIFREILQLVSIEIIIVGFILGKSAFEPENTALAASLALSVLVIFVLVNVIAWLLDLNRARRLTGDLKAFQSRFSDISE